MGVAVPLVDFTGGSDAEMENNGQTVSMDFATLVPRRQEAGEFEIAFLDEEAIFARVHKTGAIGIIDETGFKSIALDEMTLWFISNDAHVYSFR